jgi:hypothetical protein
MHAMRIHALILPTSQAVQMNGPCARDSRAGDEDSVDRTVLEGHNAGCVCFPCDWLREGSVS